MFSSDSAALLIHFRTDKSWTSLSSRPATFSFAEVVVLFSLGHFRFSFPFTTYLLTNYLLTNYLLTYYLLTSFKYHLSHLSSGQGGLYKHFMTLLYDSIPDDSSEITL